MTAYNIHYNRISHPILYSYVDVILILWVGLPLKYPRFSINIWNCFATYLLYLIPSNVCSIYTLYILFYAFLAQRHFIPLYNLNSFVLVDDTHINEGMTTEGPSYESLRVSPPETSLPHTYDSLQLSEINVHGTRP